MMNHGSVPGPQYPGGNAFRSFPRGLTPEMNMPHGRPSLTNDAIQRFLDENNWLIMAIVENQALGRLPECAKYTHRLQQNLLYLAMVADAQPNNPNQSLVAILEETKQKDDGLVAPPPVPAMGVPNGATQYPTSRPILNPPSQPSIQQQQQQQQHVPSQVSVEPKFHIIAGPPSRMQQPSATLQNGPARQSCPAHATSAPPQPQTAYTQSTPTNYPTAFTSQPYPPQSKPPAFYQRLSTNAPPAPPPAASAATAKASTGAPASAPPRMYYTTASTVYPIPQQPMRQEQPSQMRTAPSKPREDRPWTRQEHEKFLEFVEKFGFDFNAIAAQLGTRTPAQIRMHAMIYATRVAARCSKSASEVTPRELRYEPFTEYNEYPPVSQPYPPPSQPPAAQPQTSTAGPSPYHPGSHPSQPYPPSTPVYHPQQGYPLHSSPGLPSHPAFLQTRPSSPSPAPYGQAPSQQPYPTQPYAPASQAYPSQPYPSSQQPYPAQAQQQYASPSGHPYPSQPSQPYPSQPSQPYPSQPPSQPYPSQPSQPYPPQSGHAYPSQTPPSYQTQSQYPPQPPSQSYSAPPVAQQYSTQTKSYPPTAQNAPPVQSTSPFANPSHPSHSYPPSAPQPSHQPPAAPAAYQPPPETNVPPVPHAKASINPAMLMARSTSSSASTTTSQSTPAATQAPAPASASTSTSTSTPAPALAAPPPLPDAVVQDSLSAAEFDPNIFDTDPDIVNFFENWPSASSEGSSEAQS